MQEYYDESSVDYLHFELKYEHVYFQSMVK